MNTILGLPYFIDSINPNSYDKNKIIEDINYNYSIDQYRNKWDKENYHASALHHSNKDEKNTQFKKIDYSSLVPIYDELIKNFVNKFDFVKDKKVFYDFSIVNYTCTNELQYMRMHDHIGNSDFFLVHYVSFDKEKHFPTIYHNTHTFGDYFKHIRTDLCEMVEDNLQSAWMRPQVFLNVEEDTIVCMPCSLPHFFSNVHKSHKNRITIITNFSLRFENA